MPLCEYYFYHWLFLKPSTVQTFGARRKRGSARKHCKISFTPAITCLPLRPSILIPAAQTRRHLDIHLPSLARLCITGSRVSQMTGNYCVTTLIKFSWTSASTLVAGLFHWPNINYNTKQMIYPTSKQIDERYRPVIMSPACEHAVMKLR